MLRSSGGRVLIEWAFLILTSFFPRKKFFSEFVWLVGVKSMKLVSRMKWLVCQLFQRNGLLFFTSDVCVLQGQISYVGYEIRLSMIQ